MFSGLWWPSDLEIATGTAATSAICQAGLVSLKFRIDGCAMSFLVGCPTLISGNGRGQIVVAWLWISFMAGSIA